MNPRQQLLAYFRHECEAPPSPQVAFTGPTPHIIGLNVPVCERPMQGGGYDVFGVHWTASEPAGHYTPGQEPIYHDIETWRDEVRFPKIDRFDWSGLEQQAASIDRSEKLVAATLLVGPFERTTCLTRFEDCLVNALLSPEDFSDLIGAIADHKIALIERIWEIAHPDVINLHDDWGTSNSTFMSVDLWRETIKPHTKRMYDAIRSHGMLVCQHSCGAVGPLVGDMVEMGCDAWEAQGDCNGCNCNDIPALQAQYGDRLRILVGPSVQPGKRVRTLPEGVDPADLTQWAPAYEEVPTFLYD